MGDFINVNERSHSVPWTFSFSSVLVRGVYARASLERWKRDSRETRTAASRVSRFQSPLGPKKGRLLVIYPIVQFDPTRTQSDDRSPNGWMSVGKGVKVLALVVKSVVCFRSCFLCAIDVPRRTLFWTTKGINASTAGSRLSTPSLLLVGFIPCKRALIYCDRRAQQNFHRSLSYPSPL